MSTGSFIPKTIYEEAVFIDSSAFIEICKKNQQALAYNSYLQSDNIPCYIHPGIIYETHRRILFDISKNSAYDFLFRIYSSNINIIHPCSSDKSQALALIKKYWDHRITYCDAVSFSIMIRLGIYKAFSYDRKHFWTVGFYLVPV